jgi:hypothetical protein
MLRANKAMIQSSRFIYGKLYHFFRTRSESDLTGNDMPSTPYNRLNGVTYLVYLDAQVSEHLSSNALTLTHQSQQKMFCADVTMLEALRLFLRQRQDVSRPFRKQVEWSHKIRWSHVCFPMDYLPYQLIELIEWISSIGG